MRISIGIPSYNEQDSIHSLLRALELQHLHDHELVEVLISDDSSDSTPDVIKDYSCRSTLSIRLMHHDERRGAASAWNEIFANLSGRSDAVVLYDADVIPARDATMLLASSMEDEHVGLCAANPVPVHVSHSTSGYSRRIAARASVFNSAWLRRVRLLGTNQYMAMGRAMAIRSGIARATRIPDIIAIDLYMQCVTLEMGYHVRYIDDALVWFKPVESVGEFIQQVRRAMIGHRELRDLIDRLNIRLPLRSMLAEGIKAAREDPMGLLMLALAYTLYPFHTGPIGYRWSVARSSKGLSLQDIEEYRALHV